MWRKDGPYDILYAHYGHLKTDHYSICITYNPRNKTLTGRMNKVGKILRL